MKKILATVLMLLLLCSCAELESIVDEQNDQPKKVTKSPAASPKDSKEKKSTSKPKSTEDAKTKFSVGESAEYKDVIVTLTKVYESKGSDFNKPSDGNIFVLPEFTIENNSDMN